jgi:radical SAM superfamily enzyme YgiQ (UPF0313 family)
MRPQNLSTEEIALVNVPYGLNGERSMRPLGLAYLGAFLEAHDITAKGFDFSDCSQPLEDLVHRYHLFRFPVVGLSFYNINATLAYRMAKAIKKENRSCLVIGGGPHASATHTTLFEQHPEIDVVVRNEGEEALLEIMLALKQGKSLDGIRGIAYHINGQIVCGSDRDRIDDLDQLPAPVFDFESDRPEKPLVFFDRDSQEFKHATALVSSRSCPYSCSFCAIILIGRKWRKASPAKIVSDLKALERHNGTEYGHIYFLDANFFVNAKHTLEVAKALHAYRETLTFSFSTRVNQLIKGKALLPDLRNMGLRAVELGIESGSQAALDRFAKDTTPEQNYEAVQLLRENNLQLFLDFILFDAEADLDDIEANVRFVERSHLDSYVPWDHIFSYMTPYLGTEIRRHYEQLVGKPFGEDELPDPVELFQNDQVRSIFLELRNLQARLPKLADALYNTEEMVRRSDSWGPEAARHKLNAVTLRRLPFRVLRNLLSQAQRGDIIAYERALPTFIGEDGCSYSLDEFLSYCCSQQAGQASSGSNATPVAVNG